MKTHTLLLLLILFASLNPVFASNKGFHPPKIVKLEVSSKWLGQGVVAINWIATGNPISVSVWDNSGKLLGTRTAKEEQADDVLSSGSFIVRYRYFPVTFRLYMFNDFGDASGSVLLP